MAEHRYYYARRENSRIISRLTRFGGWVCGTAGVLIPLIAATNQEIKSWAAWGFVALAAAGALFGANALFTGTSSHVAYVKAQLTIEHLIVERRLGWTQMVATASSEQMANDELAARFQYLRDYMGTLAKIVTDETSLWEKVVLDQLAKADKSISPK